MIKLLRESVTKKRQGFYDFFSHKMVTPPPPRLVFVKSLFRFFSPIFEGKFFLGISVLFKGLPPCETVTQTLMK